MNRKLSAAISTWICLLVFFPSWGMAQDEPGINDFVFVEKEPVPLNLKEVRETIGFPEAAADLGVEGNVIARILVDENGNYVKHKFIGKAESLLRDAVSQHIQELSFEPALSEGKPLKFWMNVPFAFRLLTENDLVEKAISLLDAEVAQDSGNYMVYLKRGLQFKELSRVDAAIADFNTCLKLYDETYQDLPEEDTTVVPTEFKYYALYARGLTYALKGNYATASEDLSSAIQWASTVEIADSLVSPTLGNAYLERGYVNFQLENDEEAMKNYEWVIENDPEKACKAHALIAELRLLQKDLTKTVEAYDNLINCNPDDVLLFYSRGFYKGELGLLDEAITDLSVSAEKSLNSKLRVASHNRIAYLLFKAEEYDRALTAVQAAKDINVLNPISFYYEGLVLLAQNNQSAACEALNKSISYGLTGEELPEAEALVQVNCPTIEE